VWHSQESAGSLGGMGPASEPKWLGKREVVPTTIQVRTGPTACVGVRASMCECVRV